MRELTAKTVLLIRNVTPEMYGGGEKYQLLLAQELKQNGYNPVIISSCERLLKEARRLGFKNIRAPYCRRQNWSGWRNLLFPVYVLWSWRLKKWYKKILKEYCPIVINVQSRDDWIAATKVGKEMGIKVLWTDHMDMRSWVLKNVNKWQKNWIGKMVIASSRAADQIIMISEFEKCQVEKMVTPKKIKNMVVIKNGVIDEAKKYKKVKEDAEGFAFVGRMVDYKGIFDLVEAFNVVQKKYPMMKLKFYGEGANLEECQEIAKENKSIQFCGYTDEPLKAMAENKYFVMPSYIEGLSLSLIESIMMGRVVITTKVDGNPEIIKEGKTGWLIPVGNVKKLAEKMIYVIENKNKAEEVANMGRGFFEEEFDFDKIFAKKMLPLYNLEKKGE